MVSSSSSTHLIRFIEKGNNWFETREQLGPIPLYEDLKSADKLFRRFKRVTAGLDEETVKQLWDVFVRQNNFTESRVLGGFNHNAPEELAALEDDSLSDLRREQSFRDVSWLREHGTCGDHLSAGLSTIPQAGRGAFATRDLPTGTVVAQMPLIHVADRERFVMYNLDENDEPDHDLGSMGFQLLLNYCFGHGESTLLLCQYGPMASLMNHGSGAKANVKIQWGDPVRGNHMPELLESSIEHLESSDATAKLAFELVATRDIKQGEEALLDYGDDWEKAWQNHVQNWKPVEGAAEYKSSEQLNNETELHNETEQRLFTVFEEIEKPIPGNEQSKTQYPDNVVLECDSTFRNINWQKAYDSNELDQFLRDNDGGYEPCDILRYNEKGGTIFYTVMVYNSEDDDDFYLLEDVPSQAFAFSDLPYSLDMFLPNAFRHPIGIPDKLFPDAWRNLKEAEQ